MSEGITVELEELIALRRFAKKVKYKPSKSSFRGGNQLSKLRGRGMDFAEVRNYQAGDEIRHMEWRVTAKTGRPHVKLYQEEQERPVVLVTDFNPSMYFGTKLAFKSVVAARLAALLAWTAVKQKDKVGSIIFSSQEHHELIPQNRESAILPYLALLSQFTAKLETNYQQKPFLLSEALVRLRRVTRPGSIIVLISDFYHFDEESHKHLNRLRAHNDILAYHICDPLELGPPKPGQYPITNGSEEIILNTDTKSIYKAYTDYCFNQQELLKQNLKKLGIQYNEVRATTDLASLVAHTFPRRING
ncbi:MAG: DUF58 domain-containing protein [Proteobacteria bacterium]|nr:DUF58 domain-containing protein [Pseudomonadota bacterium]